MAMVTIIRMPPKLTYNQLRLRLSDYYNYKRLYGQKKDEVQKLKEKLQKEQQKNEDLQNENKDLKDQLKEMAAKKTAKKPKYSTNYSMSSQEKNDSAPSNGKSSGRIPKRKKLDQVHEERDIYPEGVDHSRCIFSHTRFVTHLRNNQRHIVYYHLYKESWGNTPVLPGVMPRGEYGVEVAITLAFLVYLKELSIDDACDIIAFFTKIELSKAQADSLLNQLSNLWEGELEKIITLITLAYFVHIDETGWKTGTENNYTWIFTNIAHTVFLYGQSRGEEALEQILSREFEGTVITDFFSTYEKYFKHQQKCWAHLLRDSIKLMLLHPEQKEYKQFFQKIQCIFHCAKEMQRNEMLNEKQKQQKIKSLQKRIHNLCTRAEESIPKDAEQDWRNYVNLHKRLIKYLDSLFTFVLDPTIEPTNNRAERGFRKTAKARNNYQTSKTMIGARRRSVIASVMTSMKQNLSEFSIQSIVDEAIKWRQKQ